MHLQQEKLYTIEDIYALPEGTRAELIDGKIYYMAPPNREHQRIVLAFCRIIADYIDSKHGDFEVNVAPFSVHLDEKSTIYVEPDLSVVSEKHKHNDKGCFGAPDWIIEVVSTGSRRMDYFTKLFKYRTAGVREYWIVDADMNRISVYDFDTEDVTEYSFNDSVKAGIYDDFFINFAEVNF